MIKHRIKGSNSHPDGSFEGTIHLAKDNGIVNHSGGKARSLTLFMHRDDGQTTVMPQVFAPVELHPLSIEELRLRYDVIDGIAISVRSLDEDGELPFIE